MALSARLTPYQFRLPRGKDVDEWWGLNRSAWNSLILPTKANRFIPPVKSLSMKQRGAARGIRLIIFTSAKAYFDKLEKEQIGEAIAA